MILVGSSIVFYEGAGVVGQGVKDGFDEDVLADEVAGTFGPGGEDFLLLHLIEGFVGGHGFLDGGGSVFEHLDVGADVIEVGKGAVAGNDFDVGGELSYGLFHTVGHALDAAAAGDVNEGKAVANEIVAHVHDVIFGEVDDGVAVGVAGGKVERADVFAIEVDGDVMLEGDDRESGLFGGLVFHFQGAAIASGAAGDEALADVILRDDGGTRVGEGRITAAVIAVIVGVDDEADRLVGDFEIFERGLDFFGEGSEFVVDDDDAVFADGCGDVAALAFEHVDVAGNFGDLDLDLGPIRLFFLSGGESREKQGRGRGQEYTQSVGVAVHEMPSEGWVGF